MNSPNLVFFFVPAIRVIQTFMVKDWIQNNRLVWCGPVVRTKILKWFQVIMLKFRWLIHNDFNILVSGRTMQSKAIFFTLAKKNWLSAACRHLACTVCSTYRRRWKKRKERIKERKEAEEEEEEEEQQQQQQGAERGMLKVKGPDIYIPPHTGKPEQQRFKMWNDVLTSISSRQRSAIIGHPLPKRTDFGPAVCSLTDRSIPQPAALFLKINVRLYI